MLTVLKSIHHNPNAIMKHRRRSVCRPGRFRELTSTRRPSDVDRVTFPSPLHPSFPYARLDSAAPRAARRHST